MQTFEISFCAKVVNGFKTFIQKTAKTTLDICSDSDSRIIVVVYLEPLDTFKMNRCVKIVNGLKQLTIFAKIILLDVSSDFDKYFLLDVYLENL